jgi:hypothetical protein
MAEPPDIWIARLWKRFGLETSGAEEIAVLDVDGIVVRLRTSDSEQALLIEADAGMLPMDVVAAARVTNRLLKVNLAMMTSNLAGVSLKDGGNGRSAIVVQGIWSLGDKGLDGLVAVVDDVVYRTELHRRDLSDEPAPRPFVIASQGEDDLAGRLIFRP